MTDLTGALLTALINHGQLLLGAVLFFAALGVPLPATMLLMAAGAFARQGVVDPVSAALTGSVAAVAGDLTSYALGRGLGTRLPQRWREGDAWQSASGLFARWGAWAVLVTRFLLTPLALPVNLLAGGTRYPLPRFLLPVVVGAGLRVRTELGASQRLGRRLCGAAAGCGLDRLGCLGPAPVPAPEPVRALRHTP